MAIIKSTSARRTSTVKSAASKSASSKTAASKSTSSTSSGTLNSNGYRDNFDYSAAIAGTTDSAKRQQLLSERQNKIDSLGLGGKVLGFSSASSSSAAKGESVSDTVRTVSCYSDIIAMRHPKEGAPLVASMHSEVPVINAGDGGHNHPTQTLTDLLTIRNVKGRLKNMTIGLCGDLKFGRTVHSLINALVRYEGIRFILISPEELRLPDYIRHEVLDRNNIPYEEVVRLEDAMPSLDILYMTRVQKERFFNEEDYVRMKDFYILDKAKMKLAPEDMYVLHPLPRVNEISTEVDNDPRAAYFRQVQYGVYVRMALILTLLEIHVD